MSDIVELTTEFRFEAAHLLPKVPAGHKCRRLHGHSYRVTVTVKGPVDEETGWLVDFGDMRAATEPVRKALDHYYLNEIDGLENPTSEVIVRWIWDRLFPALPGLSTVTIQETCQSRCTYRGETVS